MVLGIFLCAWYAGRGVDSTLEEVETDFGHLHPCRFLVLVVHAGVRGPILTKVPIVMKLFFFQRWSYELVLVGSGKGSAALLRTRSSLHNSPQTNLKNDFFGS